jgi:cation transport ATPase
MDLSKQDEERYLRAKEKVRHVKMFYIHLVVYIVITSFVLHNMFSIDADNEYKETILWVNLSSLTFWTIFIFLHGWKIFKGRFLFKQSWEDKKIKEFMKEKENKTTMWE